MTWESVLQAVNRLFQQTGTLFRSAPSSWQGALGNSAVYYTMAVRWILPLLALLIVLRCVLPLAGGRRARREWGSLIMPGGQPLPLTHWENSVGRSRLSDVVIRLPFISRSHAVVTFRDGEWSVADLGSKGGVKVNGRPAETCTPLHSGDTLSLAGLDLIFRDRQTEAPAEPAGHAAWGRPYPAATLLMLTVFQLLGAFQLCFAKGGTVAGQTLPVFAIFIGTEWLYLALARWRRVFSELELLAFFLCGVGLWGVAAAVPAQLGRQAAAILLGLAAFSALGWLIRDLDRARTLRRVLLAAAVLLMIANLLLAHTVNGARNWIILGPVRFQPMEFVKIAFVFSGAATLDHLLTTRSLTSFLIFTGACIGTLAFIKDFGTALIFFCAFLVIAFMRSGDWRTLALILAGAGLGGGAVITFIPYVSSRFSTWGHVWQHADSTGFQQTRTMIALASGGLLGVGGGKGYLVKVAAADTDLVFGVIGEEWGLVIAGLAVLVVAFWAFYAFSRVEGCRSSFYAIASCGAAAILLMQTALNMFGSVDILPLTGVTLPFVSNGGSSMVVCWCLLALIKSADRRFGTEKPPRRGYAAARDGGDADGGDETDDTLDETRPIP